MTTSPSWDPRQYLRYADHRSRPFFDLLGQVGELPRDPARIIDLGCGAGNVTTALLERWPSAHVTGLDNSSQMLAKAAQFEGATEAGGRLDFASADAATWQPSEPIDLLIANALLQWVPEHVNSFTAWIKGLTPGGTFAFQVPGNFASPSHALMRDLCAEPRWRDRLDGVLRADPVLGPGEYLDILARLRCEVDAWETTYTHILAGDDPVLDWVKGTGLRPVLDVLADDAEASEEFIATYKAALREAYPPQPYGTAFPFRRIFVVARAPVSPPQVGDPSS